MKATFLQLFLFSLCSFSFAQNPGNVSSNLVLWLKADGNVYNTGTTQATNGQTIDKWDGAGSTTIDANQDTGSGGTNNGKPTFKNSAATNINYHPVIGFDGTQRFRLSANSLTPGAANNSFYVVSATTAGTIFVQESAGAVIPKFNSDGSLVISKNVSWETIPGAGDGGGVPTFNAFTKTSGNVVKTYSAGKEFTSVTMTAAPRSTLENNNFIGERATCCNAPLFGNIAEIIGYNQTTLSGTDKNRIDSYLAIKYSISLDNSAGGTAGDYMASDATIIWDASVNPTYHNAVIAIGRDDNSALLQKQSHTYDDTTRIYLSTLASTNAGNAGSYSGNLQYVVVGNNAAKLASSGSSEFPAGQSIFSRIDREWKITNTGFTGTFSLDITLDNPGPVSASDLRILIDADGDFTDASMYNPSISYSGGIATISGISTTEIPAGSTRYMTIVSLSSATPLPVQLVYFDVALQNREVVLNWQTATETNNDYFTVERSTDANSWEEVDQVEAAGTSQTPLFYTLTDYSPFPGTSYYRLKQTDYDGQFTYSSTRSVHSGSTDYKEVRIYPNPANDVLTVQITGNPNDSFSVTLSDFSGRQVIPETSMHQQSLELDVTSVKPGTYVLSIENFTSGERTNTKVIIQ